MHTPVQLVAGGGACDLRTRPILFLHCPGWRLRLHTLDGAAPSGHNQTSTCLNDPPLSTAAPTVHSRFWDQGGRRAGPIFWGLLRNFPDPEDPWRSPGAATVCPTASIGVGNEHRTLHRGGGPAIHLHRRLWVVLDELSRNGSGSSDWGVESAATGVTRNWLRRYTARASRIWSRSGLGSLSRLGWVLLGAKR